MGTQKRFFLLVLLVVLVAWMRPAWPGSPEVKPSEPSGIETVTGKIPQTPEALLLALKGLIANKR